MSPIGVYPRTHRPLEDRFWEKVAKGEDCWEWTARIGTGGYGQLALREAGRWRLWHAHRISWELANGPIPDGLWVLHHCDNRRCVRPSHLFLGTAKDNARDAAAKGRLQFQRDPEAARAIRRRQDQRGSRNPRAKLTDDDVRAIRASTLNINELGRLYGVDPSTIQGVRHRRRYPHVV